MLYLADLQYFKNFGTALAIEITKSKLKSKKNHNLITMKTIKIKLTALSFAIAMTAFSTISFATENNMESALEVAYFEEYFDSENYTEDLEIKLVPEVRVKVYNVAGNLIATGSENDAKIKSLMNISDLLTEVNGIKYYRSSYQPTN